MNKYRLPWWLRKLLYRSAGHRYYPLVVALIAFTSTATFTFPFAVVLIPAVLIAPRRWLELGLLTGVASGIGAAVLVEAFHYFGRERVLLHYPLLVDSESWRVASEWLENHGLFALMLIAGSPMPQTPAIFFYSLVSPSTSGVMLAVGVGKSVKYLFLAWLTSRYPTRFIEYS